MCKVLVVDDDEGCLEVIRVYLSRIPGVEAKFATTLEDGLDKIEWCEMAMVDYWLVKDRVTSIAILDACNRLQTPFILCTGYHNVNEVLKAGIEMHMDSLLEKGFTQMEMTRKVMPIIDKIRDKRAKRTAMKKMCAHMSDLTLAAGTVLY